MQCSAKIIYIYIYIYYFFQNSIIILIYLKHSPIFLGTFEGTPSTNFQITLTRTFDGCHSWHNPYPYPHWTVQMLLANDRRVIFTNVRSMTLTFKRIWKTILTYHPTHQILSTLIPLALAPSSFFLLLLSCPYDLLFIIFFYKILAYLNESICPFVAAELILKFHDPSRWYMLTCL